MQLYPKSKLVRWTYLLRERKYDWDDHVTRKYPKQTTLCRFFWRAFVFMPLFWLGITGVFGFILVMTYKVFIEDPWSFLLGVGIVVGILGGLLLVAVICSTEWRKVTPKAIRESVFVQGVKSVKDKFCPVIRFEE